MTSIEICAGAGGQAIGLEMAGFDHLALVEIEPFACQTLKINRPKWNVIQGDLRSFSAREYKGIDLLAGGVPCPPFSIAGKQLGELDDRDLFPEALRLALECHPKAIMLENVRGLLGSKFSNYRNDIIAKLNEMGYICEWKVFNASEFGVSQSRLRAVLVALQKEIYPFFNWPEPVVIVPKSVGDLLFDEMSSLGWESAIKWREQASGIAPTLVGGSKKHGGADLGPSRAKKAWATFGVNGGGLADNPPVKGSNEMPKLTLKMAALIQGFPKEWIFIGKKTAAYRQVGNAFPPPVASAIGSCINKAIQDYERETKNRRRVKRQVA